MASARPPSLHIFNPLSRRHKPANPHRVARCRSLGDEGNPMDIVDANLKLLRERIEVLRKKENRRPADNGWSCLSRSGSFGQKMAEENYGLMSEFLEVVGIVGGAVGLVFLLGSFAICLFYLFVHHLGI